MAFSICNFSQRQGNLPTIMPEASILKAGTETTKKIAAETLHDVRHAMQIDYFESKDFMR